MIPLRFFVFFPTLLVGVSLAAQTPTCPDGTLADTLVEAPNLLRNGDFEQRPACPPPSDLRCVPHWTEFVAESTMQMLTVDAVGGVSQLFGPENDVYLGGGSGFEVTSGQPLANATEGMATELLVPLRRDSVYRFNARMDIVRFEHRGPDPAPDRRRFAIYGGNVAPPVAGSVICTDGTLPGWTELATFELPFTIAQTWEDVEVEFTSPAGFRYFALGASCAQDIPRSTTVDSYFWAADSLRLRSTTPVLVGDSIRTTPRFLPPACTDVAGAERLVLTATGGRAPYRFTLAGAPYSVFDTLSLPPGEYAVQVTDVLGCPGVPRVISIASRDVVVPRIVADPPVLPLGEFLDLLAVDFRTDAGTELRWSSHLSDTLGGAVAGAGGVERQGLRPLQTTTYTVTAVPPAGGCPQTATLTVPVVSPRRLYVPSAISPNADGVNDSLMLGYGPDVAAVAYFRVYDRWGNLVHDARTGEAWVPTDAPAGTYLYAVGLQFLDGAVRNYSGAVTLLR